MHEHITVFYQKVRICMDILQYFIKIIYFTIFCASPFKNMQNSTFTLILTIYVQIPCTGTSCLAMLTSGIRELWAGGGGHGREKITLGLDSTFLGRSFLKGQLHEILLINFFNNYLGLLIQHFNFP